MITLEARAKINLTLEVLGRRGDGYHDIVSIMQTVDLADTLTFEPDASISVECDDPSLDPADNLVTKAALMLRERAGRNPHPILPPRSRGKGQIGARIRLQKKIPVASGLGGGSSDAAAALLGLNALWGLGMSVRDLTPIAARLGSDVPFFLEGGTAMVQGRGEIVRPLPPADLPHLILLSPDISMPNKTATLFGRLDSTSYTRGALTRKLEARIRAGGDVPPQLLFNAFDCVAFDAFPGLEAYWKTLESLGARELHLSGAGPSIYAPVSRREVGSALHLLLTRGHGWRAFLAAPWRPSDGEGR